MGTVPGVGKDHCRVTPLEPSSSTIAQIQFYRHYYGYLEAARAVSGVKRVLEIGCGEGYGSRVLVDSCGFLVASDASSDATRHARTQYPGLTICRLDGSHLPFEPSTFDAVVAMQVVEHLPSPHDWLREVCRVLKPEGRLVITTPNAKLRLLPLQRPWNPYHVHEYHSAELRKTLSMFFRRIAIYGVEATPGVMAMERARVRQSPLRVYGRIAFQYLSRLVPSERLTRRMKSLIRRFASASGVPSRDDPSHGQTMSVSPSSFRLSEDSWDGLDLFAIAEEPLIGICRTRDTWRAACR